MRILMCGDTHGYTAHLEYLLRTAKQQNCDRIFVLGDFGLWEHTHDGVVFLNKLNRMSERAGVKVYCLDGNHDNWLHSLYLAGMGSDDEGFHLIRPHIRYSSRGHAWSWGEKRFITLGGAYSVDKDYRLRMEAKQDAPGTWWFPEEEMTDDSMRAILAELEGVKFDVMLAHDKPMYSMPGWNRKAFPECLPNQRRLQDAVNALQPDVYLHGHLHYRYHDQIGVPASEPPHSTDVYGLDCNAESAESYKYTKDKSWCVYDTDTGVEWKPTKLEKP